MKCVALLSLYTQMKWLTVSAKAASRRVCPSNVAAFLLLSHPFMGKPIWDQPPCQPALFHTQLFRFFF